MEVQAIVEKLRKLQALSRSDNEHEAELAAAKMQELMSAHRISELQINGIGAAGDASQFIRQDYELDPGRWRAHLLGGIAKANGSRICILGGDRVAVVGRPGSLPMIVETYQYLADTIERLARDGWARERGRTRESGRTWLASFRMGCAIRIRERMVNAARSAESAVEYRALIVRDDAAASEAFRREFPRTRNVSTSYRAGAGYSAGYSAGGSVGLAPTRSVGAGYRLTSGR